MDKEKHITQIIKILISFRICIDGVKISKEDKNDLIYYYDRIKEHLHYFLEVQERENENIKYRYNQNKKLMEEMEILNNENK